MTNFTNNLTTFQSEHITPKPESKDAFYFLTYNQHIIVVSNGSKTEIPDHKAFQALALNDEALLYFGKMDNKYCYTMHLPEEIDLPENYSMERLRGLYDVLEDSVFWVAGRASHIANWDFTHQYCGRCGNKMILKKSERAKICSSCNSTTYPRISPAIIVAVTKGDQILLGRGANWAKNTFSVLAGFVDIGESLEDCVKREVKEEVNIDIKNIRYFGSQPWAFPDTLMVGFTAEYAGGEIDVDENEIAEAHWFSRDKLPGLSQKPSISRELIDWYINQKQN
jgi:NAD+ diphosphatase